MFFTRSLAKFLSFIGLFIGFSAEVLAQYGAPVYFFTFKGKVKDIECDQPVKNASVKLIDRNTGYEYAATTDSLGNFEFIQERYRYDNQFRLIISDPDKRKNGFFKPTSSDVKVVDTRGYYDQPVSDTIQPDIYYVKYVNGAPCDDQPETPDIPRPIKNEASLNQKVILPDNDNPKEVIGGDSNNTEPAKIIEFSAFNLYPNPNDANFWLEFDSETAEPVQIQIFNANGALVHYELYDCIIGSNKVDLMMKDVAPGVYHCVLRSSVAMSDKPFIVQ
ncbi:MAG: hypothetical protein C0592_06795 [Marinilabiliales bacterium]|nr:MAG: hypothetical protein C0592_06795 [Marinilabiliales bacterium]